LPDDGAGAADIFQKKELAMKINRAPVMTLWAVVVAKRMGYAEPTALTLGKALAGLNAQSKGQRLGIYEPGEKESNKERGETATQAESIRLLGRPVPVVETKEGLRAAADGKAIDPGSVEKYLQQKFKDSYAEVRQAMEELAESLDKDALEKRGFALYEAFRPAIPEGKRGWGAAGELDVDRIRGLKG
jgi:hypothetical protein